MSSTPKSAPRPFAGPSVFSAPAGSRSSTSVISPAKPEPPPAKGPPKVPLVPEVQAIAFLITVLRTPAATKPHPLILEGIRRRLLELHRSRLLVQKVQKAIASLPPATVAEVQEGIFAFHWVELLQPIPDSLLSSS